MYHFDGNFRRQLQQNLSGQTATSKDTLILNAQNERHKRENARQRHHSSIVIQSYVRSFVSRKKIKRLEREKFDKHLKGTGLKDFNDLDFLLKRLLYFYDDIDGDRLILLSQFIIKNVQQLLINVFANDHPQNVWHYRIKKLLVNCMNQIFSVKFSPAIPMRMVEVFTSFDQLKKFTAVDDQHISQYLSSIFSYLIDHGYMSIVRKLLDEKIVFNTYIEETITPANQISETLFQMLERPLSIIKVTTNIGFQVKLLDSFAREILAKTFSKTIMYFIIPRLAANPEFPFIQLLQFLSDTYENEQEDKRTILVDLTDEIASSKSKKADFEFSSFLLYSILKLDSLFLEKLIDNKCLLNYLNVLSSMVENINKIPKVSQYTFKHLYTSDDSDSNSDSDIDRDDPMYSMIEITTLNDVMKMLNDDQRVRKIVGNIDNLLDEPSVLLCACKICHSLMTHNKFNHCFLSLLAFKPKFIRTLWYTLLTSQAENGQLSISLLSRGIQIPKIESDKIVPVLATFCALFSRLLGTLHDGEFFYCCSNDNDFSDFSSSAASNVEPIKNKLMPFHIKEIVLLITTLKEISLGLVELAFPEIRSCLKYHYRNIFGGSFEEQPTTQWNGIDKNTWSHLFKVCVSLLRQLHNRDLRCTFCPEGHWIAGALNLPLDKPTDLHFTSRRRGPRPFQPIRDFTRKDVEEGPPLSTKQIRSITILREIPFVVSFNTRVGVLQGLLAADKLRSQGDLQGFLQGPQIHIVVRRTHLYEDAFDKLSPENEPDLKSRFRVQLINTVGLEEAGVDGGGVFREFLSELIKAAFDPHRGFFLITKDNMLYPNPSVGKIVEDFQKHYYFIGRMLGKALYENLLVELPLAEFFLTKLAGKHSDVDIHQLASLDPILHRSLMSLKAYDGDFSDLGLDFTVIIDDLGENRVEELKTDGANIPVDSSNRIEYIRLMADFKLNRQIRKQCLSFRQGLANVLPIEWLYMFSNKELQVLISGAEIPVDVTDLMNHARYGGDYSAEHRTIKLFWIVFQKFDDLQRRQLLKFVTSCSRPPLLGFKDLDPPFCIQNSGDLDRLPSASTCMNLLKLPAFDNEEQLTERLLYAIQSGVGFELS